MIAGMPTSDPERTYTNRVRAESFGALALAYDSVRPSYPAALVDDLVAGHPASALDVGCGTGKAAVLLAARGVAVLGVEIDERMAQVARGHGIEVEVGGFEDWDDRGRRFALLTCGQAWHWIDPARGLAKAATVLEPGGLFALFWNFATFDDATERAFQIAYERSAPELATKAVVRGGGALTLPRQQEQVAAHPDFEAPERRAYPWEQAYSRDEWLELIASHSDHSTLPAEQRQAVAREVGAAIDSLGGTVRAHYTTSAMLARRR